MKQSTLLSFLLLIAAWSCAQDLTGDWQGVVWQANSADTFIYQLQLEQNGDAVSGQAVSTSKDGKIEAAFVVSGRWSDGKLLLQEVEQLRPATPQWCLKYLELRLPNLFDDQRISGNWTATGCQPGLVDLKRINTGTVVEEELPFSFVGHWAGHLAQTDREYGFFFEMDLAADGSGTSHIVSEGAGGEATHNLFWEQNGETIYFRESEVDDRTDEKWKWCLKTGSLTMQQLNDGYQMTGRWEGYMEHKSPATGACAPGNLFLTKPVLTRTVRENIAPQTNTYANYTQRAVKVDRVLRVKSNKIRIKVWDNGIVDGDILTLFLNGTRILNEYRVNKRKWSIPVDILDGENLLILHADDLGDISPNTVAVAIDDGVDEQIVIISSNLRESGAILIQPFTN